MRPVNVFGAIAIAALCAAAQPAISGNKEQLEACANSVLDGQSRNVVFAGHRFRCPGRIVVANEDELTTVMVVRDTNAYFKGLLGHRLRARPDDNMTYFITVENWAHPQNCKILWPRMQIRHGGWFRLVKEFASEFIDTDSKLWEDESWDDFIKEFQGDWEAAAKVIVAKSIEKWAKIAWPKCAKEWLAPQASATPATPVLAEIRTGANLCLDVREAEMATNGGRVEAWACNGRVNQRWQYIPTSSALRDAGGHCLDVHAGINQNGNNVQVWSCNGQWQQQWTPLANGTLRNAGGLCLDVHAPDQTKNGARVQIWQCSGSKQQRFTSKAF